MKHGKATLTMRDGRVYEQEWEEDTMISETLIQTARESTNNENDEVMRRQNCRRREQKDGKI